MQLQLATCLKKKGGKERKKNEEVRGEGVGAGMRNWPHDGGSGL